MKKQASLLLAIATLASIVLAHADESSLPAVSAPNGKLSVQAGTHDHSSVDGSFTFPLSHSWGAQIDVANSQHELSTSGSIRSVGGHLFWRDPTQGLLGVAAARLSTDLTNRTRLSIQGEKFWNDFTLRGHIGQERASGPGPKLIDVYARGAATWYAQPDLAVHLRAGRSFNRNSTGIGAEWQLGSTQNAGYAVFAETNKAAGHEIQTMVGFRVYLDAPKSLKLRHRTADPEPTNGSFATTCQWPYTIPSPAGCEPVSMFPGMGGTPW